MDFTTYNDEELDALRIEILTEQERRRLIADAPAQAVALADRYAAAIGRQDGDPWVQPTGAHDAYNKEDKVSSARLEELAALKPGWLDGEGLAVSKDALRTAESFLFHVLDAQISRPGVFPTPEGGIQMEWPNGPLELEVIVSNGGAIRVFHEDEDEDGFLGTVGLVFERVRRVLRDHGIS